MHRLKPCILWASLLSRISLSDSTDEHSIGPSRSSFVRTLLWTTGTLLLTGNLHAAVTTSITQTTGAGNLGTNITQAGNVYNITGGTRPGNGANVFHSFGNFSVGAGDIANFQNTPVGGVL